MSKKEKRPGSTLAPVVPPKTLDTRFTPKPNKDGLKDDDIQKQLNFDEDKAESRQTESFFNAIWPLFERKLNDWVESSLQSKIESMASAAVDKYINNEGKEKITSSIENEVKVRLQYHMSRLNDKTDRSQAKEDDLEQYSRRNSIRINGVPQDVKKHEDTDQLVIDVLKKELNIEINNKDLDRSHRVGKAKQGQPRQIIVKFISHNTKVMVLKKKKILKEKGSPIKITEDLTEGRLRAIKEINEKAKGDFKKLWTIDGTIFVRLHNDNILSMRSLVELDNYIDFIYKSC